MLVEDYPSGYPQYAALLASHPTFHLCRRFVQLRTRLLLVKQARIIVLEQRLEDLDRDDDGRLRLGSILRDSNEARLALLEDISDALADYDSFLERHHRALARKQPSSRAVRNLQRWLQGQGNVAPRERAYLDHYDDLMAISPSEDKVIEYLEVFIEKLRIFFSNRRVVSEESSSNAEAGGPGTPQPDQPGHYYSRDPNVYIFHPSALESGVRFLFSILVTIVLLTPVIICNMLHSLSYRLVVVMTAVSSFVMAVPSLTKANAANLIVTGTTYTTVLVVFISSQLDE